MSEQIIMIPINLGNGVFAEISIPANLTLDDVNRIHKILIALAVD